MFYCQQIIYLNVCFQSIHHVRRTLCLRIGSKNINKYVVFRTPYVKSKNLVEL